MSQPGGDEAAASSLPGEPRCLSARSLLYARAQWLLRDVWGLPAAPPETHGCLGGLKNTFLEAEGSECRVHLVVTAALKEKERWTPQHTAALEHGMAGTSPPSAAVVVVDGNVDPEALRLNLREDAVVHVIEGLSLLSAPSEGPLPRIVQPQEVCATEGLTSTTERPRVNSAAPIVQLLRAKANDVVAYPPTPFSDGFDPSGQVEDWSARIVVP